MYRAKVPRRYLSPDLTSNSAITGASALGTTPTASTRTSSRTKKPTQHPGFVRHNGEVADIIEIKPSAQNTHQFSVNLSAQSPAKPSGGVASTATAAAAAAALPSSQSCSTPTADRDHETDHSDRLRSKNAPTTHVFRAMQTVGVLNKDSATHLFERTQSLSSPRGSVSRTSKEKAPSSSSVGTAVIPERTQGPSSGDQPAAEVQGQRADSTIGGTTPTQPHRHTPRDVEESGSLAARTTERLTTTVNYLLEVEPGFDETWEPSCRVEQMSMSQLVGELRQRVEHDFTGLSFELLRYPSGGFRCSEILIDDESSFRKELRAMELSVWRRSRGMVEKSDVLWLYIRPVWTAAPESERGGLSV